MAGIGPIGALTLTAFINLTAIIGALTASISPVPTAGAALAGTGTGMRVGAVAVVVGVEAMLVTAEVTGAAAAGLNPESSQRLHPATA